MHTHTHTHTHTHKGEFKDCAVLLGANALVYYGFEVSRANGLLIQPTRKSLSKDMNMLSVMSAEGVCFKPVGQST